MNTHYLEKSILSRFDGVNIKDTYAERSMFYNPENRLPNGIYFVTIKSQDGPNDKSSRLDREGVFRASFQMKSTTYEERFDKKPSRPNKGDIVDLTYDFTHLGELMPHPVYAWMHFVCINNPTGEVWNQEIIPLLDEAYEIVKQKFEKKTRK